ncbi:hypothetical protein AABC73_21610 [Pseudomonas sp. G.S.17]|uniref:hypothetical protein n=1 Tax=Pseudomonas sp. G.S.17 TaxID=3137451 RepID=UPI00311C963F
MKRSEIQQHVFDAIGIILVDKSKIKESSSFKDLVLDEDDVNDLYNELQSHFGIVFKPDHRAQAINSPHELTLARLVTQILKLIHDKSQRSGTEPKGRTKE